MRRTINTADLFCGAGGAMTGLRLALNEMGFTHRGFAVNHWDVAVSTIKANHPDIHAVPQTVESIVPSDVIAGGQLDLLWASPSCTHHSRAKGGRPLANQLRSQPELILTWLDQLFVRRVIVENVPEITTWGPLGVTGRPLQSMKGECFRVWIKSIEARNYEVDWRILNCADYGDATTRSRFFLQAVRKGCGKIQWPEPTHSPDGETDLFGIRPRWRGMDTCIDFSDLGQLLSGRKKPLSMNTMKRILSGIERFCGDSFIMGKQSNPKYTLVSEPMMTVTTAGRAMLLTPFTKHGRVTDCFFRMLKPSELAAAHSFPADYALAGTATEQVKQIGNSVPVRTAKALCLAALEQNAKAG